MNSISLCCGFLIIFSGVYLLNLARGDPDGRTLVGSKVDDEGAPTDGIASYHTRRSMQSRRSYDPHSRSASYLNGQTDREALIHSYDAENGTYGMDDLPEEVDGEPGPTLKRSQDVERSLGRDKREE